MPLISTRSSLFLAAWQLVSVLPMTAQSPVLSDASQALQDRWLSSTIERFEDPPVPQDGASLEAGLFSISRANTTTWLPLFRGDGVGTVTFGQGVMVEGRWIRNGWEFSALVTGAHDREDGSARGRLFSFELLKHTQGGWTWGLVKRAEQWGYGSSGGYLMGDACDSVPRLILESPRRSIHLFGVPLGDWKMKTFLGRLEWDWRIPTWDSTPQTTADILGSNGSIRRPNLSGMEVEAAFGPNVDMGFGVVSEWGGVDQSGRDIMRGHSALRYLVSYFGAENVAIAESAGNSEAVDPNKRFAVNDFTSLSNANAAVDLRIRFPETAQMLRAKGFAFYLSRGAENVNWQWKDFTRRPFSAWSHDLRYVGKKLRRNEVHGSGPDSLWGWSYAEGTPSFTHPADTVGLQLVYDRWDVAAELSDMHTPPYPASTFRIYGHWQFLPGWSRYGDSLGQPLGGEIYSQGINLGVRPSTDFNLRFVVRDAIRFFRDSPLTTNNFVLGVDDHFWHAQMDGEYRLGRQQIGGSFAYEKHRAEGFLPGNRTSNWVLSLGWSVKLAETVR